MNLINIIPERLKKFLELIYRKIMNTSIYKKISEEYLKYKKKVHKFENREKIYQYWKDPSDGDNLPSFYLKGEERNKFLLNIIKIILFNKFSYF